MEKNSEYIEEMAKELDVAKGTLPPPKRLAAKGESVTMKICMSKSTVKFFRKKAHECHTSYRNMIQGLTDWYASQEPSKQKKGFLLPVVKWLLTFIYKKISFCDWLNRRFNNHPSVPEAYCLGSTIVGSLWLALIEQPVLTGAWWTFIGTVAALYLIGELLVFALKWLLGDRGPVESYRRSLLCFILNLFEVAILFTVVFWLMDAYMPTVSRLDALLQSLTCVFSPAMVDGLRGGVPGARILAFVQLFVAWVLVVVILASVVGGIQRGEKHDG